MSTKAKRGFKQNTILIAIMMVLVLGTGLFLIQAIAVRQEAPIHSCGGKIYA